MLVDEVDTPNNGTQIMQGARMQALYTKRIALYALPHVAPIIDTLSS